MSVEDKGLVMIVKPLHMLWRTLYQNVGSVGILINLDLVCSVCWQCDITSTVHSTVKRGGSGGGRGGGGGGSGSGCCKQSLTVIHNSFQKTCLNMKTHESRAIDLYVISGVLFPFPSKLSVGLQNINNTNQFFKVISCLKF
jgi:hypothetical protein